MTTLQKAYDQINAMISLAQDRAMILKEPGFVDMTPAVDMSQFGGYREQAIQKRRYGYFDGWPYSALHTLGCKAAGQTMCLGRLLGVEPREPESRSLPSGTKEYLLRKMTGSVQTKASHEELEVIKNHLLLDVMEHPNPIQRRWQFVYSFVVNLGLTGIAYIVGGPNPKGELEFYSLPSTWVRPIHKKGPFAEFVIVDPNKKESTQNAKPLTRENVDFAILPNPSDPRTPYAPIQSQEDAARIDDHIRTSQDNFFKNSINTSWLLTVGDNPFGDGRQAPPVLSGPHRRMIHSAIRKAAGPANSGTPMILDGLIKSAIRVNAAQNEIGWEKSEQTIRTRLLSAFGVHPFMMGEPVNVGGYAQTMKIEEVFFGRVNTFLDMLSCLITGFAAPMASQEERLLVWWEKCVAIDPSLRERAVADARKNEDITRNERRAELGFPPVEEDAAKRSKLLETVGGMTGANQLLTSMGQGFIEPKVVAWLLSLFFQVPKEDILREIESSGREAEALVVASDVLGEAVAALRDVS